MGHRYVPEVLVRCPYCGVPPLRECEVMTASLEMAGQPHKSRVEAYEASLVEVVMPKDVLDRVKEFLTAEPGYLVADERMGEAHPAPDGRPRHIVRPGYKAGA